MRARRPSRHPDDRAPPVRESSAPAPRIYLGDPLATGATVALPAAAAHHVARVLRLQVGAALVLFDGRGGEYAAVVSRLAGGVVDVLVGAHRAVEREAPVRVTLAQGISSGERMDYTLQKAVELGVAAIQPLATARSVVRLAGERAERRLEHWRQIVAGACEQSGRNAVPVVAPIATPSAWLAALAPEAGTLRLTLAPDAARRWSELDPAERVVLAVGPEGGFDPGERDLLAQTGFEAVRLGPRVLRTETAALAALAAIHARWGDF
ncbi:MAG: 16S rRNA (uracil(1498)-N(3))-methyltransferase [Burkholderiales bacterium]